MSKLEYDNLTIHIDGNPSRELIEQALRGLRWAHDEFGITEATVNDVGVGYHELHFRAIEQIIERHGPEGYTSGGIPVYNK